MYEAIKNFNKQFSFEPEIKNEEKLAKKSSFIVVGMGGSAHAAELLKVLKPELDIIVRRDYGLPELPEEELKNKLIILSSYSGNTEEPIDAFYEAKKKNLAMAVISTGGKLLPGGGCAGRPGLHPGVREGENHHGSASGSPYY
jgi:glucose/mannose-6-phosphate isomerase